MVAGVLPGVVDVLCSSGEGLEGEVGVDLEAGGRGDGVGEAVDMAAGALPGAWRRSSRGRAANARPSAVGRERGNVRESAVLMDLAIQRDQGLLRSDCPAAREPQRRFPSPLDDPDPERVGSVMSIHNRSTV